MNALPQEAHLDGMERRGGLQVSGVGEVITFPAHPQSIVEVVGADHAFDQLRCGNE